MKKALLMSFFMAIGIIAMNAQTISPGDLRITKAKERGSEFLATGRVPAVKGQTNVASSQKVTKVTKVVKSDEFLVGTFTARGEAYWDGEVEWEVTITKDAQQGNMYWIENMSFLGTGENPIYATLSGTTLTFPLGQSAYGDKEGLFYGLDGSGNPFFQGEITATIKESEHQIVFNHGFGVQGKDGGWYQIILAGAIMYEEGWVPPIAGIIAPRGMLWAGMSDDYYSLLNGIAYLPSGTTWEFRNASRGTDLSYSWEWSKAFWLTGEDPSTDQGTVDVFNSTDENISFRSDVEENSVYEEYTAPYLTVSNDKQMTSSYLLGNNRGDLTKFWSYILPEGTAPVGTTPSGAMAFDFSNVNMDNGYTNHRGVGFMYFGTGGRSKSLVSLYETPVGGAFYFEAVKLLIAEWKIPAAAKLTLEVYKVDGYERIEGEDYITDLPQIGDLLGYSTALGSSFKVTGSQDGVSSGALYFEDFFMMDEDGFESPVEFFKLDHDFVFIFSGYDIPDAILSVYTGNHTYFEEGRYYSFFITPDDKISWWLDRRSPMLFSLVNAEVLPVEVSASPDLTVGSVTWEPADPKLGNEVVFSAVVKNIGTAATPEGVSLGVAFSVNNNVVSWSDTHTSALAAGAEVTLTANGGPNSVANWIAVSGEHTVKAHVNDQQRIEESNYTNNTMQRALSISTNINEVTAPQVKAVRSGDNFVLTYTSAAKAVTVYNVAGQKVAEYALNSTGRFTMPAANLNGVYILKFEGTNQTVKILK